VKERLRKMGVLQPLNIFLKQELDRMQKVITNVRITLLDLKLAIEGTIIMSEVNTSFWRFPDLYRSEPYQYSVSVFCSDLVCHVL
jgi:hypothetical protein